MFGTVEYFESKIRQQAIHNDLGKLEDDYISDIISKMEDELKYDFVCDERIRLQCLENLSLAYYKVLGKIQMKYEIS